jgi:hypothetical protein
MILPGKIRGNGKELAEYLLAKGENERVWILEVDGKEQADADYLRQTILSMEHMAELTKSKKAFFHAEITPAYGEEAKMVKKDYQRCADIMAEHLGYTGQRRVIVMHRKKGKYHAHVVFERYNYETGKLVDNKHSRLKLVQARIQMEQEFGHKPMPIRNRNQKELKDVATQLWKKTTTGAEFIKAVRKAGYMVAEGTADRPFMIVDKTGRSFNLVRQLEGVRTKEVRARLRGEKLTPEKQAIELMRKEGNDDSTGKQEQQKAQHTPTRKEAASKVANAFAENRTDQLKQETPPADEEEQEMQPVNEAEQTKRNEAAFAAFAEEAQMITEEPSGGADQEHQRKQEIAGAFAENKQSGLDAQAEQEERLRRYIAEQKRIQQRNKVHKRRR